MRYIPVLLILAAAVASADDPAYVLDFPGIAFGWLPTELDPPVEGTLTEEAGAVASSPTTQGTEYHISYRIENPGTGSAGAWLEERIQSVIPPDMPGIMRLGDTTWDQGSSRSPHWENASVGLVVEVNFNFITESGNVLANGRAVGLFVGDYSILVYGISPLGVSPGAPQVVDEIVAQAYLAG
jgi:hypothetical protein